VPPTPPTPPPQQQQQQQDHQQQQQQQQDQQQGGSSGTSTSTGAIAVRAAAAFLVVFGGSLWCALSNDACRETFESTVPFGKPLVALFDKRPAEVGTRVAPVLPAAAKQAPSKKAPAVVEEAKPPATVVEVPPVVQEDSRSLERTGAAVCPRPTLAY
jgi:hypothetical protein